MKRILLLLLGIITMSFAQYGQSEPMRMWGFGFVTFVYLVLGFFLFSVIFWFCYNWIAKDKPKKECEDKEKKEETTSN